MTSHRRALLLRAGVVGALAAGALAVAAPAYADDQVSVDLTPGSFDLSPGQAVDFIAQVKNKTKDQTSVLITVSAPGNFNGDVIIVATPNVAAPNGCIGAPGTSVSCNILFDGDQSKNLGFKIGAKASPTSVAVGEQKQGQGSVKVAVPGGGADTQQFGVTLRGPAQAPTVPQVTGSVVNSATGQPIKDVTVVLVDSGQCGADKGCQTGTDAKGNFRFVARADKPIAPGRIQLGATKTGFDNGTVEITGKAGQTPPPVTIRLNPAAQVSATPSAPAEDPSGADAGASGVANPTINSKNTAGTGTSSLSWGFIGLGILLVLLGIGAMVFLLLRRKGGPAGPGDDDDPRVGGRGPGPVPPSRGIYRTAEPAGDPTMVAHNGGYGQPAMSGVNGADTTAMLRPPRPPANDYGGDGYATSYGGPPQPTSPGGTYGATTAYGSPPPPPAYGGASPYGGNGAAYDDRDRGYGDDRQQYGGGYGGGSDYGHRDEPRHGGGYRDEPDRRYDDGGGYRAGGGYDQGGYDQRGGYDQGGGYGSSQPGGGYEQGAYGSGYYGDEQPDGSSSRHSAPPPNRGGGQPGQRPPLDWLDD